ncbi:unnamed protein product [Rotaria sp. Silwood2]|nr:unnamed protein product [Rotaria sp. Silwood2]
MINASVVSSLLSKKFAQSATSINKNVLIPSIREQEVANHLAELLNSIIDSHSFLIETETSLDHVLNEIEQDDANEPDDSGLDSNFNETGDDDDSAFLQKFSLDYMKQVIEYYDEKDPLTGQRRRSSKSVKHRFRRVKHSIYLSRFRSYIEKGGTQQQKMEILNNYVYHKFEHAWELFLPVHDLDLRRWALNKAQEELINDFVASEKWLLNFKIKYTIGSRKVTKNHFFKAPNIVVSCSSSGKLTTSLVKYWRDCVLLPSISSHRTLLISDCWSGQGDHTGVYDDIRNLRRLEIPKHTTNQIQPFDVFYNNQHKYIARCIYDRVPLDELDVNLSERNNIIRCQSLIYNQLCAPIFQLILKYAWHASGYTDDHPGHFLSVKEACFTFDNVALGGNCCESSPFICCRGGGAILI